MKTSLLLSFLATCVAASAPACADPPSPQRIVQALDRLSGGPHAGERANHAKGLVAAGIFTPSAQAADISRAPQFRRAVGATIRFSSGTGLPSLSDADPRGRPFGLAIRLALGGGRYTDIVTISHNGFPVATPEAFGALLDAVAQSRAAAANPAPLAQFLDTHPAARAFLKAHKPMPLSFASQSYYGVNAFEFINREGASVFGRYQIVPVAGEHFISDEEAAQLGPDYLREELAGRVARKPVRLRVLLQLADKDDVVNDPTVVWPAERPQVELGTLLVNRVLPEAKDIERKLAYDPLLLPDGIRPSNDPVLLYRPAAYAASAIRRQ